MKSNRPENGNPVYFFYFFFYQTIQFWDISSPLAHLFLQDSLVFLGELFSLHWEAVPLILQLFIQSQLMLIHLSLQLVLQTHQLLLVLPPHPLVPVWWCTTVRKISLLIFFPPISPSFFPPVSFQLRRRPGAKQFVSYPDICSLNAEPCSCSWICRVTSDAVLIVAKWSLPRRRRPPPPPPPPPLPPPPPAEASRCTSTSGW